jgi:hypothetical protein
MKDIKSWCSDMRSQFNPAQAKQFDKFAEKVTKLLVNHKKHELQAAAVKWGLPFPLSNSPPKTHSGAQVLVYSFSSSFW